MENVSMPVFGIYTVRRVQSYKPPTVHVSSVRVKSKIRDKYSKGVGGAPCYVAGGGEGRKRRPAKGKMSDIV